MSSPILALVTLYYNYSYAKNLTNPKKSTGRLN